MDVTSETLKKILGNADVCSAVHDVDSPRLEYNLKELDILSENPKNNSENVIKLLKEPATTDAEHEFQGMLQSIFVRSAEGRIVINNMHMMKYPFYGMDAGDIEINDGFDGDYFASKIHGGSIYVHGSLSGYNNLSEIRGGKVTIHEDVEGVSNLARMHSGLVEIDGHLMDYTDVYGTAAANNMTRGLISIQGSVNMFKRRFAEENNGGVIVVGGGVNGYIGRNNDGVIIVSSTGDKTLDKQQKENAIVVKGKDAKQVVQTLGKYLVENNSARLTADFASSVGGWFYGTKDEGLRDKVVEIIDDYVPGSLVDTHGVKALYLAGLGQIQEIYRGIIDKKEKFKPVLEYITEAGLVDPLQNSLHLGVIDLKKDVLYEIGKGLVSGVVKIRDLEKYGSNESDIAIYKNILKEIVRQN